VAGSVLCYLELARELGPQQPFYGLQAAGLEGEQAPRRSVEEMAASYIEALREVQGEGPYLLGGWSFGGLVAYEMARQLRGQGQRVGLLALLDSWAPVESASFSGDEISIVTWFARDLIGLSGKELHISERELGGLGAEERLDYVLEQARAQNIVPAELETQQLKQYLEVFKANIEAMEAYRPRGYEGRVVLMRAEQQPAGEHEGTLGWSRFVAGEIDVQTIAGNHYTLVRAPQVEVLAARLSAYLEAAQADADA
jgi:thioesterase domain-containing protein